MLHNLSSWEVETMEKLTKLYINTSTYMAVITYNLL